MKILTVLYNAYCERWYSKKPPKHIVFKEETLRELEDVAGVTDENREKFESVLLELCTGYEKKGFKAGFKTALKLLNE